MQKGKILYDEIVIVAYDLYEKRGRVHGYHVEDWLEAERIVLERHAKEVEKEANTIGSTKKRKAPAKTGTRTLRTSKKTSEGGSDTKVKKSPPKKKT
ncbi:MAG TPA: DUF2934 domain-containing protein [Thermodesulfovibrionales bacterium]|nr:DUF2934 domain-containing protein [Thermodesulfovibrionales bacterium]